MNIYLHYMQTLDMNLLLALDALLKEGSVTSAAEQMNQSISAMSRTLVRIRKMMGDPILVRAGQRLVPTPYALDIQQRIHALAEEARSVVASKTRASLASMERTFTVQTDEFFVGASTAKLIDAVHEKAPLIKLRFVATDQEDLRSLREGSVDGFIGYLKCHGPEIKSRILFRDRYVCVVRKEHELSKHNVTLKRFINGQHVNASKHGDFWGQVDDELAKLNMKRNVVLSVPTFYLAMVAAATSNLIATIPYSLAISCSEPFGLCVLNLPVPAASIHISVAWHPR